MPAGTLENPVEINTSVNRSIARHFWHVVTHPFATPMLYPNLQSFLEEITPVIIEKVEPGQYFEFSTDPSGRVFQLTYDAQTEDYYMRRASPPSMDSPLTRLPTKPTAASLMADKLGITDAKKRFRRFVDESNPFPLLRRFSPSDEN